MRAGRVKPVDGVYLKGFYDSHQRRKHYSQDMSAQWRDGLEMIAFPSLTQILLGEHLLSQDEKTAFTHTCRACGSLRRSVSAQGGVGQPYITPHPQPPTPKDPWGSCTIPGNGSSPVPAVTWAQSGGCCGTPGKCHSFTSVYSMDLDATGLEQVQNSAFFFFGSTLT